MYRCTLQQLVGPYQEEEVHWVADRAGRWINELLFRASFDLKAEKGQMFYKCPTAFLKCPTVTHSCRTIVLSILKNVRLLKAGTGQMSDHEYLLGKTLFNTCYRMRAHQRIYGTPKDFWNPLRWRGWLRPCKTQQQPWGSTATGSTLGQKWL